MKRFIALTLVLCLCFALLTGCDDTKEQEKDDKAVRAAIINEFTAISEIPREPGHERAISNYLRSWARDNGFEVTRDTANNVIVSLPASEGYENAPTTILQCNMDSRITAAEGSTFDPLKDKVQILNDGETLTASGTSLGAGSGIGMATALYVLKNSQKHGPVRVIFTAGGESGMTGAEKLKSKHLEGDFLINLSWNSGQTIGIGSAGTAAYDMKHEIEWKPPQNAIPYLISVSGLNGGNAEKDIRQGGANAIKVIGEILANAQGKGILFELGSFNGGNSRDTIPTAAAALIIINESDQKKMREVIDDAIEAFGETYGDIEKNYSFSYQETEMPDKVVSFEDNGSIISFVYGIIDGVQSMSEAYPDIVESSSNLGMVSTATGDFLAEISAASNTDVGLYKITTAHEAISGMSNLDYAYHEGVPRWPDHEDSVLFHSIKSIYETLYGDNPSGDIVHHALECGWFARKNPKLQIVSIGPMIEHEGQPDEMLFLDTVTRPADVIMTFLEQQTQKINQ